MASDPAQHPAPVPGFVVKLPSRPQAFLGNLWTVIGPARFSRADVSSVPGAFWSDVFVKRGLPWLGFLQSVVCHLQVFVLFVMVSRLAALWPQTAPRLRFDHSQVVYYTPAEYLPALDTRKTDAAPRGRGDPELSRQPVISVPREAKNRSQTIVVPPQVRLKHDVAMPNIVAWPDIAEKPRLAVPDVPLVLAADVARMAPRMWDTVVAPPPDANQLAQRREQVSLQSPVVAPPPDLRATRRTAVRGQELAVVVPPPPVERLPARTIRNVNIGHSVVIPPPPLLAAAERRAIPGGRSNAFAGVVPQVVPPPPTISATGSGVPRRVIALNLHPVVGAPPDQPTGNRRGAFATTPEGHAGASGAPGSGTDSGRGSHGKEASGVPEGLYIGNAPTPAKTTSIDGNAAGAKAGTALGSGLIASAPTPRVRSVPARLLQPGDMSKLSEAERSVFGNRRPYSLTLNMPNLNSNGASWIVHFAELKHDSNEPAGDVSQPSAIRKVDPGYPAQLMWEKVAGTVILYAVIHADGTVGNVRVLRGADERLDRLASQAVLQWRFQPATKDGVAIDVEATFQVPFRPPGTDF